MMVANGQGPQVLAFKPNSTNSTNNNSRAMLLHFREEQGRQAKALEAIGAQVQKLCVDVAVLKATGGVCLTVAVALIVYLIKK